ncbi:hypothetical protein V6N13_059470 [Hibiscus sabdariffa]
MPPKKMRYSGPRRLNLQQPSRRNIKQGSAEGKLVRLYFVVKWDILSRTIMKHQAWVNCARKTLYMYGLDKESVTLLNSRRRSRDSWLCSISCEDKKELQLE